MPVRRSLVEPKLLSRPSPFSTSVTLFSAVNVSDVVKEEEEHPLTPRRSSRAKKNSTISYKEEVEDSEETDLDSLVKLEPVSPTVKSRSPKKRKLDALQESPRPATSSSPKKTKTLRSVLVRMELDTPHPAPKKWREVYDGIDEMRKRYVAPVDTMGCASAQLQEIDPKGRRLSTLVALMLSSQTKDEVTSAATSALRKVLGGSITVEALIEADEKTISNAIAKVGFWRRKTGYIKQAAIRLRDYFDSDVPKTVDELCSLPGVGPKMAFLCLQSAWRINDGIGVDVHVHRISNRLGWHNPPTKTPEETRLNLQSWLPKELFHDINHLLVGFGQTICVPTGPRCDECTLSVKNLCPSAQKVKPSKTRKPLQLRMDGQLVIEKKEEAVVNL